MGWRKMNRTKLFLLGCLMALSLYGCTGSSDVVEEREVYEVRGEYLGPQFDGKAMKVRHEEIPGYMKAMIMDFKLDEPAEIDDLEPGDKIQFRYVVTIDDAWAEEVQKLSPETQLTFE
jgi:protein SCO1/2